MTHKDRILRLIASWLVFTCIVMWGYTAVDMLVLSSSMAYGVGGAVGIIAAAVLEVILRGEG